MPHRLRDTSPPPPRVRDTSPAPPSVDPALVAAALGAEPSGVEIPSGLGPVSRYAARQSAAQQLRREALLTQLMEEFEQAKRRFLAEITKAQEQFLAETKAAQLRLMGW